MIEFYIIIMTEPSEVKANHRSYNNILKKHTIYLGVL